MSITPNRQNRDSRKSFRHCYPFVCFCIELLQTKHKEVKSKKLNRADGTEILWDWDSCVITLFMKSVMKVEKAHTRRFLRLLTPPSVKQGSLSDNEISDVF